MKTKQEVEKIKNEIQIQISDLSDKMNSGTLDESSWHEKRSIKLQKMAQYNILLEVLK